MAPLDILIIGGGMYVTGRGTETAGTIGPALLEASREGLVGNITVSTTSHKSALEACKKLANLSDQMGVNGQFQSFPEAGNDVKAYLAAIDQAKPDAAIVVVPDHLHAEITENLCGRGIHCLVVKPMAPDANSARRMIAAAEANNVFGMVEFHKRLDEANLLLRDAIQNGQIGVPLYAVIEYSQQKRIPRDIFRAWANQTSIFQYLGVHYVDLLQFAIGYKPLRVTAWGQKSYLVSEGVDTWDAMQVVIEWQCPEGPNFVSTHITNWIDPDETSSVSDQKINVVGTKGRFQSDQKNRGVQIVSDDVGVRDINPYFSASHTDLDTGNKQFSGYGIDSVLTFVRDVTAIKSGSVELQDLISFRPSFQTCLISTAVVEAAHKSLENDSIPTEVTI